MFDRLRSPSSGLLLRRRRQDDVHPGSFPEELRRARAGRRPGLRVGADLELRRRHRPVHRGPRQLDGGVLAVDLGVPLPDRLHAGARRTARHRRPVPQHGPAGCRGRRPPGRGVDRVHHGAVLHHRRQHPPHAGRRPAVRGAARLDTVSRAGDAGDLGGDRGGHHRRRGDGVGFGQRQRLVDRQWAWPADLWTGHVPLDG